MNKLLGLDINGWRDFVIQLPRQNHSLQDDKENPPIIDCGVDTAIIRVSHGKQDREKFIVGEQTVIAPHGKGIGWGEIGSPDNRILVRNLLHTLNKDQSNQYPLSKLISHYGSNYDFGVFSIDDVPQSTENFRGYILSIMSGAKIGKPLLVWRPILATLYAIQKGIINESHKNISVVCHSSQGFSIQNLTILEEKIQGIKMLIPKRYFNGHLVKSPLGYNNLRKKAKTVIENLPNENSGLAVALKSTTKLSLGINSQPEFFRLPNGSWDSINPPAELPLPEIEKFDSYNLQDTDLVIFETLTEGKIRKKIENHVKKSVLNHNVKVLSKTAIVEGAMEAARRLSKNNDIPIYYDFLPQIETIVWDENEQEVKGEKLIDVSVKGLPAGKVYHSAKPLMLGISSGQEKIEIYFRKELSKESDADENYDSPRKSEIYFPPSEKKVAVKVRAEQVPASGRAKIVLESSDLFGQKIVDWERALTLDLKWEEIIEKMNNGSPTIPDRLVLEATKDFWDDEYNRRGLRSLMERENQSQNPDWNILANKLSFRINNKFCISSDGEFPSGIDENDKALFEEMQSKALELALDRARGNTVLDDNAELKFLTWAFLKCNNQVTRELLKALQSPIKGHPFVWHQGCRKLIFHSLGRTLYQKEDIKFVFQHLLNIPSDQWNTSNHVACAAFLLSRRDITLEVLDWENVEKLATIGATLLRKAARNNRIPQTILYPPYLMMGLLRMRKMDIGSLIYREGYKENNPVAKIMFEAIKFALPRLRQQAATRPNLLNLVNVLEECLKCLEGRGRPDIFILLDEETRS